MTGRPLTRVEIDQLDHVARALRQAVNPHERQRCETNLVVAVNSLHADGVYLKQMLPHLKIGRSRLWRLRSMKRGAPIVTERHDNTPAQVNLNLIDPTNHANPRSMSIIDLRSENQTQSINKTETSAQDFKGDRASASVVIAIGVENKDGNPQGRLALTQEAKIVQRVLRSDRARTRVSLDATLVDLQHEALLRPFILHIAAHRDAGLTTLAGPEGHPTPILDEDLANAIAPSEGAPGTVVLSFCDSHQVAALIEDRDIAVISFEGQVLDATARAFTWYLYDAISLGRPIRAAFEVALGAVRGAHGLKAFINPYSNSHDRSLPR